MDQSLIDQSIILAKRAITKALALCEDPSDALDYMRGHYLQLGSGCFGAAFLVGQVVVKVCTRPTDAYPVFAERQRIANEPGVVRVLHTAWNEYAFCAVLPRLEKHGYSFNRYAVHVAPATSPVHAAAEALYNRFQAIANWDLHSDNMMFDPELRELVITDPVAALTGGWDDARETYSTSKWYDVLAADKRERDDESDRLLAELLEESPTMKVAAALPAAPAKDTGPYGRDEGKVYAVRQVIAEGRKAHAAPNPQQLPKRVPLIGQVAGRFEINDRPAFPQIVAHRAG